MLKLMDSFRKYHMNVADSFLNSADRIRATALDPLHHQTAIGVQAVSRQKTSVNFQEQEHKDKEERLRKAKKALVKAARESQLCQAKLAKLKQEPTSMKEEVATANDRCERAEKHRVMCSSEVDQKQQELLQSYGKRDDVWVLAATNCHQLERDANERILFYVRQMINIEREKIQLWQSSLDELEQQLEQTNIEQDIYRFAESHKIPDHTHLYLQALTFLDWDWARSARKRGDSKSEEAIVSPLHPTPPTQPPDDSSVLDFVRSFGRSFLSFAEPPPGQAPTLMRPMGTAGTTPTAAAGGSIRSDQAQFAQRWDQARRTSTDDNDPLMDATAAVTDLALFEKARQKLLVILDPDVDFKTTDLFVFAPEIVDLIVTDKGRGDFLKVLNDERGKAGSRALSRAGFEMLTRAMHLCLDACMDLKQVTLARNIGMMANTFYTTASPEELEELPKGPGREKNDNRRYITSMLLTHPLWQNPSFWEKNLLNSIMEQFDMYSQQVCWHDLTPEQLRTEVLRVHNTIFSQLSTIAFNMSEFGVDPGIISAFVTRMCDDHQLCTEQKRDLFRSLAHRGITEMQPVPNLIPVPGGLVPHPPADPPNSPTLRAKAYAVKDDPRSLRHSTGSSGRGDLEGEGSLITDQVHVIDSFYSDSPRAQSLRLAHSNSQPALVPTETSHDTPQPSGFASPGHRGRSVALAADDLSLSQMREPIDTTDTSHITPAPAPQPQSNYSNNTDNNDTSLSLSQLGGIAPPSLAEPLEALSDHEDQQKQNRNQTQNQSQHTQSDHNALDTILPAHGSNINEQARNLTFLESEFGLG
eukprot:c17562_g1_i2.p1 GENE.c17562_g1_i2~~c17562_g1_i2.p1  ORF type:complete len:881 (+),score=188.19 c17562_g1_i2:210-2645(+)